MTPSIIKLPQTIIHLARSIVHRWRDKWRLVVRSDVGRLGIAQSAMQ
jgi:hypothetical protein